MGLFSNRTLISYICDMKKANKVNVQYLLWKEGKYYVAQCINIDVSSFGKTKKEAIFNITEALELHFEV
jgi:predicted RNase H-like HicB family nuclease